MRGYRYRIYPDEQQKVLFAKTFGCSRLVYNKLLEEKIEHYEKTGSMLSNTSAHLKVNFPWLKEVDSTALSNAANNLDAAFSNFFRDVNVGFPKFKSKKNPKRTYTSNAVRDKKRNNCNIKVERQNGKTWMLCLPKVGAVRMSYHRTIPDAWIIKSVTVEMTPSGQYYASILCETDKKPMPLLRVEDIEPGRIVGLDFSLPQLYVSSNGETPGHRKFFRTDEKKIARERRKMDKCEKGSKNREKQKKKVNRLEQRVADRRRDFLHKESRRMANAFDIVCVEDINVRDMAQALNFGKSANDAGWGMFRTMLGYKLAEKGGRLVKVDKYYPSSKLCSQCGSKKDSLELSERIYVCEHCAAEMDRDINAAINIRREGIRIAALYPNGMPEKKKKNRTKKTPENKETAA